MITDLGALPGQTQSIAYEINEPGQIVGESLGPPFTGIRAFLWKEGVMIDLGHCGRLLSPSRAFGLNNRGQVVGESLGASPYEHAFLWAEGSMIDLGTLPADSVFGTFSRASAINNRGQVVARERGLADESRVSLARGVMTDLGTLPGGSYSYATDINDRGDVIGVSSSAAGGERGSCGAVARSPISAA